MVEPVLIDIKTPQGWTLQPGMRLSPHDSYRFEHIRTQKLSQLLTHCSLRERGFHTEICSGLPPSICPGQKSVGTWVCRGPGRAKGRCLCWWVPEPDYSFSQPVREPNFSQGEWLRDNTARASHEGSVTLCCTVLVCVYSCQVSESLSVVWRRLKIQQWNVQFVSIVSLKDTKGCSLRQHIC